MFATSECPADGQETHSHGCPFANLLLSNWHSLSFVPLLTLRASGWLGGKTRRTRPWRGSSRVAREYRLVARKVESQAAIELISLRADVEVDRGLILTRLNLLGASSERPKTSGSMLLGYWLCSTFFGAAGRQTVQQTIQHNSMKQSKFGSTGAANARLVARIHVIWNRRLGELVEPSSGEQRLHGPGEGPTGCGALGKLARLLQFSSRKSVWQGSPVCVCVCLYRFSEASDFAAWDPKLDQDVKLRQASQRSSQHLLEASSCGLLAAGLHRPRLSQFSRA